MLTRTCSTGDISPESVSCRMVVTQLVRRIGWICNATNGKAGEVHLECNRITFLIEPETQTCPLPPPQFSIHFTELDLITVNIFNIVPAWCMSNLSFNAASCEFLMLYELSQAFACLPPDRGLFLGSSAGWAAKAWHQFAIELPGKTCVPWHILDTILNIAFGSCFRQAPSAKVHCR